MKFTGDSKAKHNTTAFVRTLILVPLFALLLAGCGAKVAEPSSESSGESGAFEMSADDVKAQDVSGSGDASKEGQSPAETAAGEPSESPAGTVRVTLSGGTGRATVEPVAALTGNGDDILATIIWSSSNYDYMVVDGEKYYSEAAEGENSRFTIPVSGFGVDIPIRANTTAMSEPHEIEYTLRFEPGDGPAEGGGKAEGDERAGGAESGRAGAYVDELTGDGISEDGLSGDDPAVAGTSGAALPGADSNEYATGFGILRKGSYRFITLGGDQRFLLVPREDKKSFEELKDELGSSFEGLDDETVLLRYPVNRVYLASSSAFDLVRGAGAMDKITLSAFKGENLYVKEARKRLDSGAMAYAGKYSAPDYERILMEDCELAIENTMIYHSPQIKEKLESLGIPVLVEYSSYEQHPLGRLEWIKLYGALFDCESQAEGFYQREIQRILPLIKGRPSGKTVAFFHVNTNGVITVRRSSDYIARIIELTGGTYIPELSGEPKPGASTVNIGVEDFYKEARDADILIYNSTIEGELFSVGDLLRLNPVFEDFKAVKEGRVFCAGKDLFQKTTGICEFIEDISYALDDSRGEYHYLRRLE